METQPVSVLMSVYNASSFLRDALESVLRQTYANFEYIIINDGSTDNSGGIISSINDSRIKYVDNGTNLGLVASLNKGIAHCTGKYIIRMDADDICLPDRIKKQVEFMEQHPEVGVAGCDYIEFGKASESTHIAFRTHDEILGWMLFNCAMVHPSLVIRSSVIKTHLPVFNEEYKHVEDYELWSRILFSCKFANVPEVLFKYRSHSSQVSKKHRDAQISGGNKVREALLKKAGFTFSDEELRVHCLLGNSQIINSIDDLKILSVWFDKMSQQNESSNCLRSDILKRILAKQWYDACGITSLGLKAWSYYRSSRWSKEYNGSKVKLFIKCIVRWLK